MSGHFASGLYAAHATATAESAVAASFTGTSTRAMNEPPSGASRMVAGPRTTSDQPAGATKVFPATVVLGVSAVMRSGSAASATHEPVRLIRRLTRAREAFGLRAARLRMVAPKVQAEDWGSIVDEESFFDRWREPRWHMRNQTGFWLFRPLGMGLACWSCTHGGD